MKCLVDSKELAQAAAHVQKAANRDRPQIRLTADRERLTLEAVGLEGYSRVTLDADTPEPGTVNVNAVMFAALTGVLPAGEATVSVDVDKDGETWVNLKVGHAHSRLRPIAADSETVMPDLPETMTIIPDGALGALIDTVAPFADPRNATIPLRCVHIVAEDGTLAMKATNRICYARRETHVDGLPDMDALVAAERLKTLARDADRIGITDSSLFIGRENGVDSLPLQSSQFPDRALEKLSRDDSRPFLDAPRAPLAAAVKMVSAAYFNATPVIPIALTLEDGMLRIVLTDEDSAGSQIVDDADVRDADMLPMKLDARYLTDALGAFDGRTVRFTGTTPIKPVRLTSVDEDGAEDASAFVYVNPIRTQEA